MITPGLAIFKLGFQLSPIILTGGIAESSWNPLGLLPIVALTEGFGLNAVIGLASGSENVELDGFFANFEPLPGATLIQNQVAVYPFANQAIAANAMITQPLQISMLMKCPVRNPAGYATKLATMMMLQAALESHNRKGGTYTVITPSYLYIDCVMVGMRDVSGGETEQKQWCWQIDFLQPLVSLQSANNALSSLMSKMGDGSSIGDPTVAGAASAPAATSYTTAPAIGPTSTLIAGAA